MQGTSPFGSFQRKNIAKMEYASVFDKRCFGLGANCHNAENAIPSKEETKDPSYPWLPYVMQLCWHPTGWLGTRPSGRGKYRHFFIYLLCCSQWAYFDLSQLFADFDQLG